MDNLVRGDLIRDDDKDFEMMWYFLSLFWLFCRELTHFLV